MISLSDAQLAILARSASLLPQEKRADYLVRVAAHLQISCGRYCNGNVAAAAEQALNSLIQHHHMAPEKMSGSDDEEVRFAKK